MPISSGLPRCVRWEDGAYVARACRLVDGRRCYRYLGRHDTPELAARAVAEYEEICPPRPPTPPVRAARADAEPPVYPLPRCIRFEGGRYRAKIERAKDGRKTCHMSDGFLTLAEALAALAALVLAHPPAAPVAGPGRPRSATPPVPRRRIVPTAPVKPAGPPDERGLAADLACQAYLRAREVVLATPRTAPAYAPLAARLRRAGESVVAALRLVHGRPDGPWRAGPRVVDGHIFRVDSAGDLHCTGDGKPREWAKDEHCGRRVYRENGGKGRRKSLDLR